MNQNEVFNFDHEVFGKLTVLDVKGKAMFVANEVAEILGYSNKAKAIQTHIKDKDKSLITNKNPISGLSIPDRGVYICSEKGVYTLIMKSKLTQAEQFQDWVMDEVLPTIRKTGGYVSDSQQMVDTLFPNVSPDQKQILGMLFDNVKENQHKVDFFHQVADAKDNLDMNQFAKVLDVGRNTLFKILREQGYIMENSRLPYERYKTAQKWFKVIETSKNGRLFTKTLVTPKGQIELSKRLKEVLAA